MLRRFWLALLVLAMSLSACQKNTDATDTDATDTVSTPLFAPDTSAPTVTPTEPTVSAVAATVTVEGERNHGNADVTFVRAVQAQDGSWTFSVTVSHPDTGWDDYADGWDVMTPDGTVLKQDPADPFTRLLLHPHVGEQPFTRSQSGLDIPGDITEVTVRAHDMVAGYGGEEVVVNLTMSSGADFVVEGQQ